jgi:hypothetical protein
MVLTSPIVCAALLLLTQAPADRDISNARRLREMREVVQKLACFDVAGSGRKRLPLLPAPLHRWTDPAREYSDGTLWAWGGSGRPSALFTLELHKDTKHNIYWSYEFITLAQGPVAVEGSGLTPLEIDHATAVEGAELRWSPRDTILEFHPLPKAPKAASTAAARQRQTRELLKRFAACEYLGDEPTQYELRLLPQPIHRYADPPAGLVDGAIFVYAYGTNPEIVLVLEAQSVAGARPVWQYGCARMTTASPEVTLDGKPIWTLPKATQTPDAAYTCGWLRREP